MLKKETGAKMQIKQSKPIEKLKKGDKVKVNGKVLEVDAHYVFEDYKNNKRNAD